MEELWAVHLVCSMAAQMVGLKGGLWAAARVGNLAGLKVALLDPPSAAQWAAVMVVQRVALKAVQRAACSAAW